MTDQTLKFYVIVDKSEGVFFIRTNPLMLSFITNAEIEAGGGSLDAKFDLIVNKAIDFAYEFDSHPDQAARDQVRFFKDNVSNSYPDTIKLCFGSSMSDLEFLTARRGTTYSDINRELTELEIPNIPIAGDGGTSLRREVEEDPEN